MHHTLQIQEILLNIFGHCLRSRSGPISELLALARTCRGFKEPALDVLWEELFDSSPLARCLPEAAHQISPTTKYAFRRPLTQVEWDILRSYTRRIRSINFSHGLDWESVKTFLHLPITESFFPNLRYLDCDHSTYTIPLFHLPLPSLVSLDFAFVFKEKPHVFEDSLQLFHALAPHTKRLSIRIHRPDVTFDRIICNCICHWRNLQHMFCPAVSLDVDTLVHLSRMPTLTRLAFTLSSTLPDQIISDSPLVFTNLRGLELHSHSLASISGFLSRTRLPAITDLSAFIQSRLSKQKLSSFLTTLWTSGIGHVIQELQLIQVRSSSADAIHVDLELLLHFKDLQPCMAFRSLRLLNLDIECNIVMTDCEVLTLTSAWPHLERLVMSDR